MIKNKFAQIMTLLLLFSGQVFGSSVTHYGALNEVNDVVQDGNTLFFATGGGLVEYDLDSDEVVYLENAEERLPDISLKSLYRDADGTLWAGSDQGYFYRKTSRGNWSTYQDFLASGAVPNKIIPYNSEYLLIAHTQGISIFSKDEEQVISTVSTPGVSGQVFDLLIEGDTLFASVEEHIVKLDSLEDQLLGRNFRNKSSWENISKADLKVRGLVYNDRIVGYTRPALAYEDTVIYGKKSIQDIVESKTEDDIIKKDTIFGELVFVEVNGEVKNSMALSSEVTSITLSNNGKPIVTTANDYSILDPFDENRILTIPGVILGTYQKSLISESGDLWLISTMREHTKWFEGFTRFDGDNFHFYNKELPGFGSYMGDLTVYQGLVEAEDGRVFVGSTGPNVRVWDPTDDSWSQCAIKCKFDIVDSDQGIEISKYAATQWIKVDGILRDSSDNIWFSLWAESSTAGASHRVAILNPSTDTFAFAHTRRDGYDLFSGEQVLNPHIGAVLSNGDLVFAEPSSGEYLLVPASADPFKKNIDTLTKHNYIGKKNVRQIVATENGGNAIVATSNGLSIIRSDVNSIAGDTITISGNKYESNAEDYLKLIYSIAVEKCEVQQGGFYDNQQMDSIVTTTFWASVSDVGIERFVLREYIKDSVSSAVIQTNENPVILSSNNRLFLTGNTYLSIDKERNYLWIAGENGLSRYHLGYSVDQSEGNSDTFSNRIYPNPYSKSNHDGITIDHLSPNAYIDIYTLSGNLIAHFDSNSSDDFANSGFGKIFIWTPSSDIAPGTYLVAMKDSDTGVTDIKKMVIIP